MCIEPSIPARFANVDFETSILIEVRLHAAGAVWAGQMRPFFYGWWLWVIDLFDDFAAKTEQLFACQERPVIIWTIKPWTAVIDEIFLAERTLDGAIITLGVG